MKNKLTRIILILIIMSPFLYVGYRAAHNITYKPKSDIDTAGWINTNGDIAKALKK